MADTSETVHDKIENETALFEYAKDVFNEQRNVFRDLESKAARYLTVLTAFLGAAGFFGHWIAKTLLPPKTCMECMVAIVGLLLIGVVFLSWLLVFWVLKIGAYHEMPLSSGVVDRFRKGDLPTILSEVTAGILEAYAKNSGVLSKKAHWLNCGHRVMIVTVATLLFCALLFAALSWGANRRASDVISWPVMAFSVNGCHHRGEGLSASVTGRREILTTQRIIGVSEGE